MVRKSYRPGAGRAGGAHVLIVLVSGCRVKIKPPVLSLISPEKAAQHGVLEFF